MFESIKRLSIVIALTMLSTSLWAQESKNEFSYNKERLSGAKPWTSQEIQNDPAEFQFVVIGDRTGGANVARTFEIAIAQINLLQPEFVINVGDLIEGYSDDPAEENAEWDESDKMLAKLNMPFVRTPGNHDIANETAQQVWRDRHGATYYHFVYKDVLFMVLDSENPPRVAPEGIKEKLAEYNRLQAEDPAKAQELLDGFMTEESVIAYLAQVIEFGDDQKAWIKKTLADNPDVRWTFLFLHEPAWEVENEHFEEIQAMLKDRKHTFLAGHLHYYDYDLIDGTEHITMGPAGASLHHAGPGNVDHLMWVTMTEDGPEIANIALKGIFNRKGVNPELFDAFDRGENPDDWKKEEK